ncbi:Adenylate and Guanylate cyclase catalytic domain containing protein [Trichomonas vaginalis G3]|uniref:Adenylate and Guanylate cyclase catalytic domain containing protein n=1 Tax=Trichomonas vaginalis (strain ATCC PRA-98 / G3) TaxID=412133 RepID=A2DLQ6_TRIV3|nr:guanylate cyclase protein [Trichomonas vaginalis G3]EAY18689.1 Adenylate and Guanylate cyclase catalytic domain containing protein [Trichomonas vaginalis G3]KAI5522588.1 guanylate cyclase protein [Trichomonas vaginalis G3]|eukprot:XP_001579675.1 Adenylate and Guanylate cyclase catalytic domain containing protein [Trichomonas vaginalis G3]
MENNTNHSRGSTSFSSNLSMSVTNRWAGMIEQSVYKKTRNSLFQLISYVYIQCPSMFIMHTIVSIFRLLQFVGPLFFVSYKTLWSSGSMSSTIVSLFSVFFHIFPPSIRESCTIPFLGVYVGLLGLFFIFTIYCAFYYKQNAKLPDWVPIFIYVFLNTFGYLLHPIAFQLGGEELSLLIMGKSSINHKASIALLCLTLIFFGIYTWLIATITSTSILFNPTSLLSVVGRPQLMIFILTNVVTLLISTGTSLTKIPRLVLLGVAGIGYIISIMIPFIDGGFISFLHSSLIFATSMAGPLLCIGCIVLEVLNVKGTEVVIILILAIWGIMYVVSILILNARRRKILLLLDEIEESQEAFERVKSPRYFSEICVQGFANAHPICISCTIFTYATNAWQDNVLIWVLYAKFATIYPEETMKIGWIQHQMMSLHIKGATSKHIQEEIITIIRTREINISAELKKKLNRLNKKVQLVKNKLRHIWDLVIQGNTGDMDTYITLTYNSIEDTLAEYNHIMRQYPNSRFVARSYARFMLEVLADHEKFNEWAEKSKLLQRGITVKPDHAHELGVYYFPNLPQKLEVGENQVQGQNPDSESNFMEMDGEYDEKTATSMEQSIALRRQIENLRIPSTFHSTIQRILIIFILFLLPIVAATVLIFSKTKTYSEPLTYLQSVSLLRTYLFMTVSFGVHYIHTELDLVKPIESNGLAGPSSLGGTFNLTQQFSYLLNELTSTVQDLNGLRAIAQGNVDMDSARHHLFGNFLNFTQFKNTTSNKTELTSVSVGIMEIVTQLSHLTDKAFNTSIYEDPKIVTPTYNAVPVADAISLCLNDINNYMDDHHEYITKILLILQIVCYILIPVLLFVFLYVEIKHINNNKLTIYKCMTSLPKNVVSGISDSFKMMKDEQQSENASHTEQDSKINKQEENMLKIFATATDSSGSKFSDAILMVTCTVLSVILAVLMIYFIDQLFMTMSISIHDSAPNMDNLMGAFAYQCSMMMMLSIVSSENVGYSIHGEKSEDIITKINTQLVSSLAYFHKARYGKEDGSTRPFNEFNEAIVELNEKSHCSTSNIVVPKNMRESYECLSLEMLYYSVETIIESLTQPMEQNHQLFFPNETTLTNLWDIETEFLYDKFFHPIFTEIIPFIEDSLLKSETSKLIVIYVIFVLELLVELYVIYHFKIEEQYMRFALKLLLHCTPSTITQIPLIVNVLGGNFKSIKGDSTLLNKQFFDEVLVQLPDPLIIVDESGCISSVNTQGQRMFQQPNLIGTKMSEFWSLDAFERSIYNLRKQPPQEEEITYVDTTNTKFNLSVKSLSFNQVTAYLFKDITQNVRYNTLIDEERGKSDKLLESILPAKLVRRVQQGEKNISFSVQSASVVFMDIVSFTPWCGSLPANRVMEILNRLYKEFDAKVASFPTMTKIKCIGDCYMAAGGIFAEINQPAVHAKEIVEFGIEAIGAVGVVNEETKQSLQIRVGINTGGPLVAGVLGSGKPTFEILGPTINMAQQMEHHGVPMQVHISRAVYELIYGGNFKIKERGQIEIKNGTVVTYLVSP